MKFAIKVLGVLSVLLILSGSAYAGIAAPLTHPYSLEDPKGTPFTATTAPSTVSGNLGASAGAGTGGDGSSAGTAVLGFSVYNQGKDFVDVKFSFGDSAKVTTTGSEFGSFLLNPESGRSFVASYWRDNAVPVPFTDNRYGGYLNLGFAFADFVDASDVKHPGFLFFPSVGLQFMTDTMIHEGGEKLKKKNKYNLGLQLGLTGRFLGGEFSKYEQKLFRQDDASFGLRKNKTFGVEAIFFATVNEMRPYLKVTYLDPGSDVTGFSDWQAYLGIDIQTSVFTHELK